MLSGNNLGLPSFCVSLLELCPINIFVIVPIKQCPEKGHLYGIMAAHHFHLLFIVLSFVNTFAHKCEEQDQKIWDATNGGKVDGKNL